MQNVDADTNGGKQPGTTPSHSMRRRFDVGQHTLILLALVALALARGLLYAVVIPPWQAPDEPKHFEYARLVADKGRLVTPQDRSVPLQQAIIDSMVHYRFWDLGYYHYPYDAANPPQKFNQVWVQIQASTLWHPPVYYGMCAIVMWPWRAADVATQLYAMRLLSVLLFAGTVVMAFLTAREIFPTNTALLIAIPASVLWQPTFTFISSSVNNDNLANLVMAGVIWLLVRWYMRGFTLLQGLAIVALLVLGTLTKRTTLFAWPLAVAAVPLYLWGRETSRWMRWAWLAGLGAVIAGTLGFIALLLGGQGGSLTSWLSSDLRWATDVLRNPDQYRLTDPTIYAAYAQSLFTTFWAAFGWLSINLEKIWYLLLSLINLFAVVGLALLTRRSWRGQVSLSQRQKRALVLLAATFVLALGFVLFKAIREQTFLPGDLPQGRYLFPVIVPISALLVTGLWQWVPVRYQHPALIAFLTALVMFDTWCLMGYILPAFYLT